ncbi:hypothetical protein KW799_02455 [Candidatus Parcubacteria bacterium]|nr:hypothetical protein [Candidatus Parcubacteria bacterium]
MREYQERRRLKRFLHSRYAIAALAVLCLLLTHAVWGAYQKYRKSGDISERIRSDVESLEARQASLSQSINALDTVEGREKEIRDRFGVVKDGERMVVLVDDSSTDRQSASAAGSGGWWSKLIGIFGF